MAQWIYSFYQKLIALFEWSVSVSTFNVCRSVLGERQRVWGNDQHGQFTEDQSEHGHDQPFVLGLVQEVGWTVTSHRRSHEINKITWNCTAVNRCNTDLKILEDPLVNPWHSLFLRVRMARTKTTTSYRERRQRQTVITATINSKLLMFCEYLFYSFVRV